MNETTDTAPLFVIHEQNAIACALVDATTMDEMDGLEPQHFFLPMHQIIWRAMLGLADAGEPLTYPSITTDVRRLSQDHDMALAVWGYLPGLVAANPVPVGAEWYAEQIRQAAMIREVRHLMEQVANYPDDDARILMVADQITQARAGNVQGHKPLDGPAVMEATIAALAERRTAPPSVPLLLPSLRHVNVFRPGHVCVLAGRTGEGKSLLALQMAYYAAKQGTVGLYVSLEMSMAELGERNLSSSGGVPTPVLTRIDRVDDAEFALITQAALSVGEVPLYVMDDATVTTDTIISWMRRLKQQAGLRFVVVDYLQLLPMPDPGRVQRHISLGDTTRKLKAAARALGICVLVVSQLNREGTREDAGTEAVAGSDAIGHNADMVMAIRPDKDAGEDGYDTAGLRHLHLRLLKNRFGAKISMKLVVNPTSLIVGEVAQ
jgi:replicative DNA helicase